MKKTTLTVGIPAYNEENNIGRLINAILRQTLPNNLVLENIIVVSDGSTDSTVNVVNAIRNRKIKIVALDERQGIASAQNKIIRNSEEDILIILNGDVLPKGRLFLRTLITPLLLDKKVGIVGADTVSLNPKTYFEKVIADSHAFKVSFYRKLNNGNTIYLCHGRARAFSKSFYKTLRWPNVAPEDAYSFFYCIKKGFKFVFVEKAKVFFRSPINFHDHAIQSKRFVKGNKVLRKYFSNATIDNAFYIPKKLFLHELYNFFKKDPLSCLSYVLISMILKFPISENIDLSKWEISKSSKFLSKGVKLIL